MNMNCTEFDLLDEAVIKFESEKYIENELNDKVKKIKILSDNCNLNGNTDNNTDNTDNNSPTKCLHEKTLKDSYIISCCDCGEELEINNLSKITKNKYNIDPSRCQIRNTSDRSIYKDVESMGFSDKILYTANQLYTDVTKGNIKRGISRKAIIFACVFQAYNISGKTPNFDDFIESFRLKRKSALKGIKFVTNKIPKHYYYDCVYIDPIYYIHEIMAVFNGKQNQIDEVCDIFIKIKNKSKVLNGSRAQSVASGLVYFWMCKNDKNINIKDYTKRINLSELTIKKIYKEIEKILESSK